MKQTLCLLLLLSISFVLVTGCGSTKLPDDNIPNQDDNKNPNENQNNNGETNFIEETKTGWPDYYPSELGKLNGNVTYYKTGNKIEDTLIYVATTLNATQAYVNSLLGKGFVITIGPLEKDDFYSIMLKNDNYEVSITWSNSLCVIVAIENQH